VKALNWSQDTPCGTCRLQNGIGTGFSPHIEVFPCQYHSTIVPYSSSTITIIQSYKQTTVLNKTLLSLLPLPQQQLILGHNHYTKFKLIYTSGDYMAQDRVQWWTLINTNKYLDSTKDFLSSWATTGFSRTTFFREVSQPVIHISSDDQAQSTVHKIKSLTAVILLLLKGPMNSCRESTVILVEGKNWRKRKIWGKNKVKEWKKKGTETELQKGKNK
jgi:hypothetical protein